MAKMIYTTYQTNSFKIIKPTFSTYELPHAPVIFPVNLGAFNCFENFNWGGGGVCPPPGNARCKVP